MKNVLSLLILSCLSVSVNAADFAKCVVAVNGNQVQLQEKNTESREIKIRGNYSYQAGFIAESYNLYYNYEIDSAVSESKLKAKLTSGVHTFNSMATGNETGVPLEINIVDHEGQKIEISCDVL